MNRVGQTLMGHISIKLQQEDGIAIFISIQSSCGVGNQIGIDPFTSI